MFAFKWINRYYYRMRYLCLFFVGLLSGCVSGVYHMPDDFMHRDIHTSQYDIFTYVRITDDSAPIRIYVEGDGNSFDIHGRPTHDPTPRGTLVRDWVAKDTSSNVVYLARPCQYVMSASCTVSDWTSGRFSSRIIASVADAIIQIAQNRPVILIGYSGGALVSGLVINNYPQINVQKWITVAGVLNHTDWTSYFGDSPLTESLDMTVLPRVPQTHLVAEHDTIVPISLSKRWTCDSGDVNVIPNATHDKIPYEYILKSTD